MVVSRGRTNLYAVHRSCSHLCSRLGRDLHTSPRPCPHTCRSFQGFCCLMQLSSRNKDYVVDTLALRSLLGPALAPLLSDAAVVKVLHGADKDVEWLQV